MNAFTCLQNPANKLGSTVYQCAGGEYMYVCQRWIPGNWCSSVFNEVFRVSRLGLPQSWRRAAPFERSADTHISADQQKRR
jgi:hypothetical protein